MSLVVEPRRVVVIVLLLRLNSFLDLSKDGVKLELIENYLLEWLK